VAFVPRQNPEAYHLLPVSEKGYIFKSYLNVEITDDLGTDIIRDNLTSKAQDIYRSLTIKQTSVTDANKEDRGVANHTSGIPVSLPITEDQRVMLGTAPSEGRQAANLEQELEIDRLLGVTDRVCKQW